MVRRRQDRVDCPVVVDHPIPVRLDIVAVVGPEQPAREALHKSPRTRDEEAR